MEQKIASLEQMIESHTLTLSKIKELEWMGLGLKELKQLHYTIKEIAKANGFSSSDDTATTKFFDDIENNYDAIQGFQKRSDELGNEIKKTHYRA